MKKHTYSYKKIYVYFLLNETINVRTLLIQTPNWKKTNCIQISSAYGYNEALAIQRFLEKIFVRYPSLNNENKIGFFHNNYFAMWSFKDDVEKYKKLLREKHKTNISKVERFDGYEMFKNKQVLY